MLCMGYAFQSGAVKYPESHTTVWDLYAAGSVDITLAYDPNHASVNIVAGKCWFDVSLVFDSYHAIPRAAKDLHRQTDNI